MTNRRTWSRLVRGEGEREDVGGRIERGCQQRGEGLFGDGDFVGGNGQTAFDDMENAFGGAAVALRIVQNALSDSIGLQIRRRKEVFARGQRHGAGEARPVEHEASTRAGAARLGPTSAR